jgi:hypothetical protein
MGVRQRIVVDSYALTSDRGQTNPAQRPGVTAPIAPSATLAKFNFKGVAAAPIPAGTVQLQRA